MNHFPPETAHIKSYFRDLAAGSNFYPDDLTAELRLDWDELTFSEKADIRDLTKKAAKEVKALKADGFQQRARERADEAAAKVVQIAGERINPKARRKLPDDPRELAKLIRRP